MIESSSESIPSSSCAVNRCGSSSVSRIGGGPGSGPIFGADFSASGREFCWEDPRGRRSADTSAIVESMTSRILLEFRDGVFSLLVKVGELGSGVRPIDVETLELFASATSRLEIDLFRFLPSAGDD